MKLVCTSIHITLRFPPTDPTLQKSARTNLQQSKKDAPPFPGEDPGPSVSLCPAPKAAPDQVRGSEDPMRQIRDLTGGKSRPHHQSPIPDGRPRRSARTRPPNGGCVPPPPGRARADAKANPRRTPWPSLALQPIGTRQGSAGPLARSVPRRCLSGVSSAPSPHPAPNQIIYSIIPKPAIYAST